RRFESNLESAFATLSLSQVATILNEQTKC
ncbi:flavin oxidoreductase / NADH oxidase family protein, partial [Vibrio parahaemolyticus V-223/04]